MLTQKNLKLLVYYDMKTGIFKRRVKTERSMVGSILGYRRKDGYVSFFVGEKKYLAHRLAILYVDGYMPEGQVDHEDRIRHHNQYDNLRPDISRQCQARNSKVSVVNNSGIKGVCFNKKAGKWMAEVCVGGKGRYLGIFPDFDEAVCARFAAEQCLSWGDCDNSSSAYSYVKGMIS